MICRCADADEIAGISLLVAFIVALLLVVFVLR